jgi:hypothetical protein
MLQSVLHTCQLLLDSDVRHDQAIKIISDRYGLMDGIPNYLEDLISKTPSCCNEIFLALLVRYAFALRHILACQISN